jgi:hypothetical protein
LVVATPPGAAGATALILELVLTVKLAAGVDPNSTDVVVTNPVPMTVTLVPVARGPAVGVRAVTVGLPTYRKVLSTVDVPPKADTATEYVPAVLGGAVAVSRVGLVTDVTVAGVPPKVTDVTVVKPVPVTVTFVGAVATPLAGVTAVTVGAPTVGPEDKVKVTVSAYVPGAAFAGMCSHQSVASWMAPSPVALPAVARTVGRGPRRAVAVSATG